MGNTSSPRGAAPHVRPSAGLRASIACEGRVWKRARTLFLLFTCRFVLDLLKVVIGWHGRATVPPCEVPRILVAGIQVCRNGEA